MHSRCTVPLARIDPGERVPSEVINKTVPLAVCTFGSRLYPLSRTRYFFPYYFQVCHTSTLLLVICDRKKGVHGRDWIRDWIRDLGRRGQHSSSMVAIENQNSYLPYSCI